MKIVKVFSLAAVAAIVVLAFVGTSSTLASGSFLLCKKAELECKNPWLTPVTWVGHATKPKLLTNIGTIECDKSLIELTLLQTQLAKLQLAHILSLTFEGNCHLGATKCTVTVERLGGMSVTHGPNPLEWVGILAKLISNTAKTLKCGFLLNCAYEVEEGEVETTATNNAEGEVTMVANEAELNTSSGFCPEISKLDVTYVGLGTGLWIES
jgi:hypothetical protein